jgi:hypothetical protein
MGQQQLLLIILGTIIVGVAIAVAILMFQANSIESNKSAIVEDMTNLAADVHAFYMKPTFLGGGGRSFVGYNIPQKLRQTENGKYVLTSTPTATIVSITATSSESDGTIIAKIDNFHNQMYGFTYSGAFDNGE